MDNLRFPSLCFNCRRKLWPGGSLHRTYDYLVGVIHGIALVLLLSAAYSL